MKVKSIQRANVFVIVTLMLISVYSSEAYATLNLLNNGSFETGTDPNSWLRLDPGSTAIDGWTVINSRIDYIGTYWQAADGSRSLDLDGGPTESGGIEQTFTTTPGDEYLVTFDMAGNPAGPPTTKLMRVEAAGDSSDFSFDIDTHTLGDMGWVSCSWQFTATDTETTLEFYSTDDTGDFGPALDNVVVTPIPEPTTLCLLALGAALLRRSRR
jgi:choice-of-anchor C domain-containing protein